MKKSKIKIWIFCCLALCLTACNSVKINYSSIGLGWNSNSINTVKFRKNALTTFGEYQFTAYYDENSFVVLGKRKINTSNWELLKTNYKGNTKDAHNTISIAIDGDGYIHVSWDHHNTKLRYAKSKSAMGLELGAEISMTGFEEQSVTYPEFYNLKNGNILFFYRSGSSGRGNMVINSYDLKNKEWIQLQKNLLDGENKRSAYWQSCVDEFGTIHLSWVWRETWDVSSNHDLCYARSKDGGVTWENSKGTPYQLPITAATAEYAWRIPQNSSLINQTSMTFDANGNPYIATYWSEKGVTQFQIVYLNNGVWKKNNSGFRKLSFSLGGGGTKQIPISRPEILIDDQILYLLFRDEERANKISLAYANLNRKTAWKIKDFTKNSVGQWEPNYDLNLWKSKRQLHVFCQDVQQIDGEGLVKTPPSTISVLEVKNMPK